MFQSSLSGDFSASSSAQARTLNFTANPAARNHPPNLILPFAIAKPCESASNAGIARFRMHGLVHAPDQENPRVPLRLIFITHHCALILCFAICRSSFSSSRNSGKYSTSE
jgi:hypothetical protein